MCDCVCNCVCVCMCVCASCHDMTPIIHYTLSRLYITRSSLIIHYTIYIDTILHYKRLSPIIHYTLSRLYTIHDCHQLYIIPYTLTQISGLNDTGNYGRDMTLGIIGVT